VEARYEHRTHPATIVSHQPPRHEVSVQAMGWVLEDSQAESSARLVLLSVANHASARGGNVYAGLTRLAHESRVHRATVIRALAELEQIGELLVYPHQGVAGRGGMTNRYEMPLVPGWKPPLGVGEPRTDPCGYHSGNWSQDATTNKLGVASDGEVVAPRASSGRNLRPEPSLTGRCNQRCTIEGIEYELLDGCWVPLNDEVYA